MSFPRLLPVLQSFPDRAIADIPDRVQNSSVSLSGCAAEWNTGTQVHFRLCRSGTLLLEHRYPRSESLRSLDGDPTPFAEPEDFDLLLFVTNVLNDPARVSRLFR